MLTGQKGYHKTNTIASLEQRWIVEHIATRQEKQVDVQEEEIEKEDPRRTHGGNCVNDSQREPGPDINGQRLRELFVKLTSAAICIRRKDAATRNINHGVGEVECSIRWEDSCSECVASDELHDPGEVLADSAEKHHHSDKYIRCGNASSVDAVYRDEEDTWFLSVSR